MRARAYVAMVLSAILAITSAARAFVPLALEPPRVTRVAAEDALVVHATALADERVEGWTSRCQTAEALALRVGRRALHGYVDDALLAASASPAAVAAAHDVVETGAEVRATRTLVDCAVTVTAALPLARLREATSAWSISW